MAATALNELLEMLMSEKDDVRICAFLTLAQLTGTDEGASLVGQCKSILSIVVATVVTTSPQDKTEVLPITLTTLTNIATSPSGAISVMKQHKVFLSPLIKLITEPSSRHADRACGLLANLSRDASCCRQLLETITSTDLTVLHNLLVAATTTTHNTADNELHLLMAVLENISQLPDGRKLLLNRDRVMVQRVLPFVSFPGSASRRRAAVSTLHNCCFQKEDHMWLLGPDVDIASSLCLPLAGPDTFTEEDNLTLPDMLAYQSDDKEREPSAQIRLLLLEALTQLCSSRPGREELRRQNIYLILRELHKWETDPSCLSILEDLVNILIRTEDDIGADDLSALEVPEDLQKKFIDLDVKNHEEPIPAPAEEE